MTTMRFFLLVTLLVAVVLAAPTSNTKKSIQKRSFKVPRHLNKNHPRGPNGWDAMRKVAMKYNLATLKDGFISDKKGSEEEEHHGRVQPEATNSTTNGTGNVAANPEENAKLFLSPVEIGGQTFNLDFDSGSSDLWIFSTELSDEVIGRHAAFDAQKSSTFKQIEGAEFEISYGDGSGAAGIVGTDTVNIGGVVVENQAIELANNVSGSFIQDTNTDGLVGLAFSSINTVTTGNQRTPQKTFFDNVMDSLDLPVFTADLNPDGSGEYEFGSIDSTKFEGDLTYVPVQANTGFWLFDSAAFAVGDQVVDNTGASPAIADTGTSLLLVDQAVADAYYSQVASAQLAQDVGGFVYDCSEQLPDIAVAIGNSYMAVVPGDQVTFAAVDETNQTCFGGVQGNQGAGLQIFGDILFRSQFMVFDGGNQSLGIAPKPGIASANLGNGNARNGTKRSF